MKAWEKGRLLSESNGRSTGKERSGLIGGEGKNNPVTKIVSLSVWFLHSHKFQYTLVNP